MTTNLTSTGFRIDILNELKLPPLAFKSVSLSLTAPSALSTNLELAAYVFLSNQSYPSDSISLPYNMFS